MKLKYKPKPLTKAEAEALMTLLDYVRADEQAHFERYGSPPYREGGYDNHIFHHITTLDKYVSKVHVEEYFKKAGDNDAP